MPGKNDPLGGWLPVNEGWVLAECMASFPLLTCPQPGGRGHGSLARAAKVNRVLAGASCCFATRAETEQQAFTSERAATATASRL